MTKSHASPPNIALMTNEHFGSLRSLMNQHHLNHSQRLDVWNLLVEAAQSTPHLYKEVWLPYTKQFPHHFNDVLTEFQYLDDLNDAVKMVPHAVFELAIQNGDLKEEGGIHVVAAAESLRAVVSLSISYNQLDDSELHTLLSSPHLTRLRELDLSGNPVNAMGLAESPACSSLTTLSLEYTSLDDNGLIALANSRHLTRLTTLSLAANFIDVAGLESLAYAQHLQKLTSLDLGEIGLSTYCLSRFLQPSNFRLNQLFLRQNRIDDNGASILAQWPHLKYIKQLNLSRNPIGNRGAIALAKSPYIGNLEVLQLRCQAIDHAGISALANTKSLQNLKELDVVRNDGVSETIANSPFLCDSIRQTYKS